MWSGTRVDAKGAPRPVALQGAACRPRRLPPVQEFVAVGSNWTAFRHQFDAAWLSVGWMEEEALRALPTALDDNALVAFRAILESDRSTLQRAYAQMAAVFDPPYNARRRFLQWKRGEAETPLAFRSTLLALGQEAYPHMDWTALDSLAVERLLSLAQELGVVLTTTEDDELTSLKVAR
ncbi:unnamed protein product [Lampetra planeri]